MGIRENGKGKYNLQRPTAADIQQGKKMKKEKERQVKASEDKASDPPVDWEEVKNMASTTKACEKVFKAGESEVAELLYTYWKRDTKKEVSDEEFSSKLCVDVAEVCKKEKKKKKSKTD